METGLAVQDPSTRRYGLGPLTLVLGTAYQRRIDLRAIAAGPMTALRDLTGETVGLSVRVGEELLHIDQVESRSELRRTFEIGKALPLWAGAPSRVLPPGAGRAPSARRMLAGFRSRWITPPRWAWSSP